MKVKMKTLAAGPRGILSAGAVYDLPDDQATPLVEGGYAEALGEPARPKPVDPQTPPENTGGEGSSEGGDGGGNKEKTAKKTPSK